MVLTITSADLSLAAELGLFLIQQPVTDVDRDDAQLPGTVRIPETWLARSALTKKPVGHLRFTAVDSLYVSKYAAGVSSLEETVADALRWIAPITRHVRTGQYAGTEVIVRRFGSMIKRPRALTECGARSTGADYSPSAAQSELINGRPHEMCPACRARLTAHEDSTCPPAGASSSTVRQQAYIRRLLDEGAQNGRPCLMDEQNLHQLSRHDASVTIDRLRALKERNWKDNP
jgi:hypothetical protein